MATLTCRRPSRCHRLACTWFDISSICRNAQLLAPHQQNKAVNGSHSVQSVQTAMTPSTPAQHSQSQPRMAFLPHGLACFSQGRGSPGAQASVTVGRALPLGSSGQCPWHPARAFRKWVGPGGAFASRVPVRIKW